MAATTSNISLKELPNLVDVFIPLDATLQGKNDYESATINCTIKNRT